MKNSSETWLPKLLLLCQFVSVCLLYSFFRCIEWPRGRVLGGSSSINAMLYARAHAYDYDRWEKEGAEGWSYADCLPYFKKSQTHELGKFFITLLFIPRDRLLLAQPISIRKAQSRKKTAHKPLRTSWISLKMWLPFFYNHTILLFWLQNKQTFPMFSQLDLYFVLCSRDLDVPWCAKDHGLFLS